MNWWSTMCAPTPPRTCWRPAPRGRNRPARRARAATPSSPCCRGRARWGRACSGPAACSPACPPGATWIDMSTSIPAVADKVRALAGGRITVLDAPVAGGITGARDGTLQIFVGGATEDYLRMRPLLEVMGDGERIMHVGSHGAGYT